MADSNQVKPTEARRKPPNAGKGRKPGSKNKLSASVKDAIIKAAENAGGEEGMIGYLTKQAKDNPNAFLSILGRVVPMETTGSQHVTVTIKRLGD